MPGTLLARPRNTAAAGLTATMCLVLTGACGDGGGSGSGAKDSSGRTTIRVTYPTNVSNVPLHMAVKKGYFKDERLDVKTVEDLGSGSTVEAVAGGQADMAWANVVGGLTAYDKGIGIKLVAITDTASRRNQQVLVPKKSKARNLADLRGKKLAVLAPTTICILNVRSGLKARGLPTDGIEFTPVNPPEHPNVLSSGEVDATCTSDPLRTQMIRKMGARPVFETSSGELAGYPVGGYLVSDSFAKENPKAIAAFRRALTKATRYANAHKSEVRALLPSFAETERPVARRVVLNKFLENADEATLRPLVRRVASAMHTYGLADKPINSSGFLAAGE